MRRMGREFASACPLQWVLRACFFLATTPLRSLGVVDLFGKTRTFRNIGHAGFNYKNFLAMQFRGLILRESGQAANSLPSRDL